MYKHPSRVGPETAVWVAFLVGTAATALFAIRCLPSILPMGLVGRLALTLAGAVLVLLGVWERHRAHVELEIAREILADIRRLVYGSEDTRTLSEGAERERWAAYKHAQALQDMAWAMVVSTVGALVALYSLVVWCLR